MKKEDYYGKYILRDGDLKPCEIDKYSWEKYEMSDRYCSYLEAHGLLFDNIKEAMMHYKCIMGAMKKPVDEREKERPRIYISGPIDGYNIEERRKSFKIVQTFLEAQGWETFNPMENGLPEDAKTCEHMRRDLHELTREDKPYNAIYMLKRWTHSKGCKTEFDNATAMNLDIYFEESDTMIKFQ